MEFRKVVSAYDHLSALNMIARIKLERYIAGQPRTYPDLTLRVRLESKLSDDTLNMSCQEIPGSTEESLTKLL